MNKIRTIRNEDVNRVLVGVPKGHTHRRICIALQNGLSLIFQEATVANILRATLRSRPTLVSKVKNSKFKLHRQTRKRKDMRFTS